MKDIIIIIVLIAIFGCSIGYIIRAKKNGVKCIGCPMGGSCGKKGCPSDAYSPEEVIEESIIEESIYESHCPSEGCSGCGGSCKSCSGANVKEL